MFLMVTIYFCICLSIHFIAVCSSFSIAISTDCLAISKSCLDFVRDLFDCWIFSFTCFWTVGSNKGIGIFKISESNNVGYDVPVLYFNVNSKVGFNLKKATSVSLFIFPASFRTVNAPLPTSPSSSITAIAPRYVLTLEIKTSFLARAIFAFAGSSLPSKISGQNIRLY